MIKSEVTKKYGQVSYENLIIQLYDQMVGRDDFQLKMAYKPDDMTDPVRTNYLLLDRGRKEAAVCMNSYKTVGRYGKAVYRLTNSLAQLITKLHPNDNAEYLFPLEKTKLSSFLIDLLKKIDLFKNEERLGIKYLRHSLVSTKLMQIKPDDPNYTDKVVALAENAMHSVKMQETYTSPLKDAKGKLLNNSSGEMCSVFDELVHDMDIYKEDENIGKHVLSMSINNLERRCTRVQLQPTTTGSIKFYTRMVTLRIWIKKT